LLLLLLLLLIILDQMGLFFGATPAATTSVHGASWAWTRGRIAVVVTMHIRDNVRSSIAAVAGIGLETGAGVKGSGGIIVIRVIVIQGVGNVIVMGEG